MRATFHLFHRTGSRARLGSAVSTPTMTQSQNSPSRLRPLSSSAKPCEEVIVESPSQVTEVVKPFFDRQEPLLLRHLLKVTPKNQLALENFPSWDYWETTVDESTDCHVEIGGNYSQSQVADIPFVEFLSYLRFFEEQHGRNNGDTTSASTVNTTPTSPPETDLIYMAQNDLFPEIQQQIEIPDFCESVGEGKLYSTMVWMGPYGCVSPLHYDPLDNVLLQYVGQKIVYLCAPNSPVQAGAEGNQKNTSPLDPEQVIADGGTVDLGFQEATLYPGDALYIPKKWYHHVRTIETSVSVNSWFR